MKALHWFVAVVLLVMVAASPALAVSFTPVWDGYQFVKIKILDDGGNALSLPNGDGAGIGKASAWVGGSYAPRVFCVDVFKYGTGTYEVDVHTSNEAIPGSGWTSPQGDTDHWRDPLGLRKAAFLAQKWGTAANMSSDSWNKTVALNTAIWQAAYGGRFQLAGTTVRDGEFCGELTEAQWGYFKSYRDDYLGGNSASYYKWYDSAINDGSSTNQDFVDSEVPEPGTVALIGGVLLGSALLRFRRKRSS